MSSPLAEDASDAARRLHAEGRFLQAAELWAALARDRPGAPEPVIAQTAALVLAHRAHEALDVIAEALPQSEDKAALWTRAGLIHRHLIQPQLARAAFEQALEVDPGYPAALTELGELDFEVLNFDSARTRMHQALARLPAVRRAAVHQSLGETQAALAEGARAVAADPGDPTPHVHMGRALLMAGRLIDAASAFSQALQLDPTRGDALFGLGECRIHLGDAPEGWRTFERTVTTGVMASLPAEMRLPLDRYWRGDPAPGKRLLIVNFLGLGDNIMAVRYAQVFTAFGAEVTWCCPPPLHRLLAAAEGVAAVASLNQGLALDEFDHWSLDYLLPGRLGAAFGRIPAWEEGYLSAPAPAVRARSQPGRLRVGLCWSSGGQHFTGHARFLAPEDLRPLAELKGVEWVVVQKTPANAEIAARSGLDITDPTPLWSDFQDAAQAMSELDLVISICSAPLHLAGALGKEVWGLICAAPDWRWGRTSPTSPWYPRLRLFRQEKLYDWSGVVGEVKAALAQRLEGS